MPAWYIRSRQPHDAQADAAGAVGGLFELRHGGDVGVGFHHVVQEDGGERHALAQLLPIDSAVRAEVLGQVDRAEAAVLVGTQPLLAALVGDDAVGDHAVGLRLGQVVHIGSTGRLDGPDGGSEAFAVGLTGFALDKPARFGLFGVVNEADRLQEQVAVTFVNDQFIIGVSGVGR